MYDPAALLAGLDARPVDEIERLEWALRAEIDENKHLRDAQETGSLTAQIYQDRITAVTRRLLTLEERAPELRDVAAQIRRTETGLLEAQIRRERASHARLGGAGVVVLVGVLLMVLAVGNGVLMLAVIAVALIAAGGLTAWHIAKARRLAQDDMDDATREIADLRERKNTLLELDVPLKRPAAAAAGKTAGVLTGAALAHSAAPQAGVADTVAAAAVETEIQTGGEPVQQ